MTAVCSKSTTIHIADLLKQRPVADPARDSASCGAAAEAAVVWQGSDAALDQHLEELMPEGPPYSSLSAISSTPSGGHFALNRVTKESGATSNSFPKNTPIHSRMMRHCSLASPSAKSLRNSLTKATPLASASP